MSLILPKGIVVNSPEISDDIGRIDREPLADEEIAKLWKVYTTTTRRLLDPTAERLENFWWRIWGSSQRRLKGATVARLFSDISDGETFIPLRGPPNRDEGGPETGRPLATSQRFGQGASSSATIHAPSHILAHQHDSSAIADSSRASAQMPPPILKKKGRGPSSTGPRPTARFISPHSSEEEAVDHAEDEPSGVEQRHVQNTVFLQPTSSTAELQLARAGKKPVSHSKKKGQGFVASNVHHKKRPVIVRRQSSQTSVAEGSRDSDTSNNSLNPVITESAEEHIEQSKLKPPFKPTESRSSSPDLPTTKPPKKRGNKKTARTSMAREFNNSDSTTSSQTQPIKHASKAPVHDRKPASKGELIADVRDDSRSPEQDTQDTQLQLQLLADYNASLGAKKKSFPGYGTPDMAGDHFASHAGRQTHEPSLKSSVSLAPSYTAAVGNLQLGESLSAKDMETSSRKSKGKDPVLDLGRGSSSIVSRGTPATSARGESSQLDHGRPLNRQDPLGQSMGQLSRLLEQDRARAEHKAQRKGDESKGRRMRKGSSDK